MLNLLYNFLFIYFLIYLTLKTNNHYFKFDNLIFILSLFFHLFLTAIYIYLFPKGDWDTYIWLSSFGIEELTVHNFFSSHLIKTIIVTLQKFLFLSQYTVILIFSLISFFGIAIFILNLIKLGLEKKIASWLLFIPGIHFWTGIPGKDCLILFSLSCFFYFYIDRKIYYSLLFILIVTLIRPHIGAVFLLSIGITEFIVIKGIYKKLIVFLIACVTIYGLLHYPRTSGFFMHRSEADISDNIIYPMLKYLNVLSIKYSLASSSYEGGNIISNIFNYIFFPIDFIYKLNSVFLSLSILVETLTFILISSVILRNKNIVGVDIKLIYFLSICVLIYCLILPQVFFNYGLNTRQKWMIIPFIIYLSFLFKNLFVKINKI